MKGLEVGDTLVRLTRGYWKVGDRLEVVAFGEGNKLCWAVLNEPGHSHRHAIELPLDETVWDVDYTAGPTMREPSFDEQVKARQRELKDQFERGEIGLLDLTDLAYKAGIRESFPMTPLEGLIQEIAIREQPPAVPSDGGWHRGDWMQTFTGARFYPLDPKPEDVHAADIAHALSMLCRYNGHIDRFYSVAEHCVLMSYAMPTPELALEALLHDASEAYCGDMVRPLKHSGAMGDYIAAENKVTDVIAARFGLKLDAEGHHHKSPEVQDADTRILLTERTALMSNYKPSDRWSADGMEPLAVTIDGWGPELAESYYLLRLRELAHLGKPS